MNKSAITKNPIFETDKMENVEVINKELKDFCICHKDDEMFLTVRTTDNKHFFASGVLATFLKDNLNEPECFMDEYGNYSFNGVKVIINFNGQKRSKAGRNYNDWKLNII